MDLDLKEIILEQRPEQRRTSSFICIFAIQKRVDTSASRKLTENGKIWSWWLKRGELLKSVPYVF